MPAYLFKNVIICDPRSPLHGQITDIETDNGVITATGPDLPDPADGKTFDFSECIASPAFTDLRCHGTDPGFEHRETIHSLASCAMAGGYAAVAVLPNCDPVRQSKSDIEYLLKKAQSEPVEFLPLGAVTTGLKSADIAEMHDMKQSGAVAFSNADYPVDDIGTMSRAMQYSKSFGGLVFSFCQQNALAHGAYVSEGTVAVSLGLKGIPQMAEYLQVQREIELADYHQTRIHLSKISTERSVDIIRQAKAQGIQVTCDTAVMNLVLTDENIMEFDSNLKLRPPLRQANDVRALWQGIEDGTIDAICSDHNPMEREKKVVEFEYAASGAVTLQIAYSLASEGRNRFLPGLSDEKLLACFTGGPAGVLKREYPVLKEGEKVSLTIINPHQQMILSKRNNRSRSENTWYLNKPLPCRIEATVIGKNCLFNKQG